MENQFASLVLAAKFLPSMMCARTLMPRFLKVKFQISKLNVGSMETPLTSAVLTDERFTGRLPLFGGLDTARFRRQVGPGDTLELHVELGRMSARAGKGSGRAVLHGEVACECDLMFVLVDA